jgi:uncharacterized repeat protein (TIGR01451 family)
VARAVRFALQLLLIGIVYSPPARLLAQTPAWPTTWNPIGACSENDPAGNTTPGTVDLVGAPGFPAAFLKVDDNFLYLRERIFQNPAGPGGFVSMSWVVLLTVPGANPFKYQWLIALDGTAEQVGLWENDQATALNISFSPIFNDPAETLVFSGSTGVLARIVLADSSIGGAQNYFVDWAMPRSQLTLRGIDPNTALYWFATSANANNYNKATLNCPFSPTTTLGLTKSVSPSAISVGVASPVSYTVTVTNTGTYGASGVVVSDNDFASWW